MTPELFKRGQRAPLGPVTILRVSIALDLPGAEVDCCCFGVDKNSQLTDDRYLVFYNQPRSPEGAIEMSVRRGGREWTFSLHTDALPAHVQRLVFTAAIDGPETMATLGQSRITLAEEVSARQIHYTFSGGDFSREKALLIGEVYLKGGTWRFGAIGQGFQGDLSALLAHFGGEEEVAPISTATLSQPAPRRTQPQVPPPASAASVPQLVRIHPAGKSLQQQVDEALPHSTLALIPSEYEGPIVISKPLRIEGSGSTLWSRSGPVLLVQSGGVTLHNLKVEVTVSQPESELLQAALVVEPNMGTQLEDVTLRGNAVGVEGEGTTWSLPFSIDLGRINPREVSERKIMVTVPVACMLSSKISGVELLPRALSPGSSEVTIRVSSLMPNAILVGDIEITTALYVRKVQIIAHTHTAT